MEMEDKLLDAKRLTEISRVVIEDTRQLSDRIHQETIDTRRLVSETRRSIEKARRVCAKANVLIRRVRRGQN
jgi:hypothetical protein